MEIGSITSWHQLKILFITKYGQKKTQTTLVQEISTIKINPKEAIKNFNQRFMEVLNMIPQTS